MERLAAWTPALLCAAALLAAAVIGIAPVVLAYFDIVRLPQQALDALLDPVLWPRLGTTALIAGATLAVIVPVGLLQGWLLSRTDMPLRRPLMMLTPLPLFLPPLIHVLSWFGLLGLGGVPAIILVYIISFMPFVVLLAVRSFDQISREHMETMRVLGGRRLVFLDEMRQAIPAALIGAALALVFLLSDFAVADFLTSVGPKVTVYADTLYAHHLAMRPAGAAAAALPGLVLCLGLLMWALRWRRRLGAGVSASFEPAPAVELGGARWLAALGVFVIVSIGTLLPLGSLLWQAGSVETIVHQASAASERIQFTLIAGALAATGMVIIGIPLAALSANLKRPWWVDLIVFLPLAVPPLLFGIGLIRTWNHPGLDAVYTGMGVVLIAMIGRYLAFAYLPIGGAIERLDPALFDSARLAGAGPLARIRRIMLPLIASPAIAAWCISFCFTLRELDTLIMLRAGQNSLTYHLYANVVFAREEEVAALALILALVTFTPLLLYLLCARRAIRLL